MVSCPAMRSTWQMAFIGRQPVSGLLDGHQCPYDSSRLALVRGDEPHAFAGTPPMHGWPAPAPRRGVEVGDAS